MMNDDDDDGIESRRSERLVQARLTSPFRESLGFLESNYDRMQTVNTLQVFEDARKVFLVFDGVPRCTMLSGCNVPVLLLKAVCNQALIDGRFRADMDLPILSCFQAIWFCVAVVVNAIHPCRKGVTRESNEDEIHKKVKAEQFAVLDDDWGRKQRSGGAAGKEVAPELCRNKNLPMCRRVEPFCEGTFQMLELLYGMSVSAKERVAAVGKYFFYIGMSGFLLRKGATRGAMGMELDRNLPGERGGITNMHNTELMHWRANKFKWTHHPAAICVETLTSRICDSNEGGVRLDVFQKVVFTGWPPAGMSRRRWELNVSAFPPPLRCHFSTASQSMAAYTPPPSFLPSLHTPRIL